MTLFRILIVMLLTFKTAGSQSQDLQGLDSITNHLINTYNIKGFAMIGVKNGDIVYSKGFGSANEKYGMNADTPLYIASNTKAFVGLAMARLIAQGKIKLEDPLIEYIDRTYFPSELQIESITIGDILSHNHGLSNDPMTFRTSSSGEYPENLQELLKFTEYYQKGDSLIKTHHYSNFGYLLSGIVIENITGLHWKDYVTRHVLSPLMMNHTSPYLPEGELAEKMAAPYSSFKEGPLKIVKKNNTMHAAGGLVTNLNDMAHWLRFFTMDHQDTEIFNEDLNPYFNPLVHTEDSLGPLKIEAYGFGWYQGRLFDQSFNFHTGGFSGHASFMSYMPAKQLGFFIFTNEQSSLFRSALQLVMIYYGLMTNHPGNDKINNMFSQMIQRIYANHTSSNLVALHPATLFIPTGYFYNEKYGTLRIIRKAKNYEIFLGKNLQSTAFQGTLSNEFRAEFVPGRIEQFFVEVDDKDLKIRYDDFGFFLPKAE